MLRLYLAIMPTDIWLIDTGATTHISVTMQGCLRSRMPTDDEIYIYAGNGNKVAVKVIGIFILQLDSNCTLNLKETFVVSSFRRNLISISCLEKCGYYCSFRNGMVSLYRNSNVIGTGSLTNKLYKLNIKASNGMKPCIQVIMVSSEN